MNLTNIDLAVGYLVIFVTLPAMLCLPVFTFSRRWHPLGRYVFSVIATGLSVNVYHAIAVAPVSHMRAAARGEIGYDGVGSAAAMLITGIVLPAVIGVPFYLYAQSISGRDAMPSEESTPEVPQ